MRMKNHQSLPQENKLDMPSLYLYNLFKYWTHKILFEIFSLVIVIDQICIRKFSCFYLKSHQKSFIGCPV